MDQVLRILIAASNGLNDPFNHIDYCWAEILVVVMSNVKNNKKNCIC